MAAGGPAICLKLGVVATDEPLDLVTRCRCRALDGTFESEVNTDMESIVAGLGDEYADAGGAAGTVRSCFKGDGVQTAGSGPARVVVEMHDSTDARVWNEYLEIAERRSGRPRVRCARAADNIDKMCNTTQTGMSRHLGVALDALAWVALEAAELGIDGPDAGMAAHGAA